MLLPRIASYLNVILLACAWFTAQASSEADNKAQEGHLFEQQAIASGFPQLQCFQSAIASGSKPDLSLPEDSAYSVELPSSFLAQDAFSYSVIVDFPSRTTHIWRSGGFAGTSEVLGPLQMGSCIREAMVRFEELKELRSSTLIDLEKYSL